MTPQQLVGLGLRLLAIWLAITTLEAMLSLPFALRSWGEMRPDATGVAIFGYAMSGWWLLVAVLLWFFPMWTAHKLIPRTRFENKLNVQPLEAARVGCALMGLWLLINNLSGLMSSVYRVVFFQPDNNVSVLRALTPDDRLSFAVAIGETVFALVLIFYSASFARLVLREPKPGPD